MILTLSRAFVLSSLHVSVQNSCKGPLSHLKFEKRCETQFSPSNFVEFTMSFASGRSLLALVASCNTSLECSHCSQTERTTEAAAWKQEGYSKRHMSLWVDLYRLWQVYNAIEELSFIQGLRKQMDITHGTCLPLTLLFHRSISAHGSPKGRIIWPQSYSESFIPAQGVRPLPVHLELITAPNEPYFSSQRRVYVYKFSKKWLNHKNASRWSPDCTPTCCYTWIFVFTILVWALGPSGLTSFLHTKAPN